MTDEANIALITAGSTIVAGLLGQGIGIFYQGRLNNIERIRIIQARASQLYDREIRAYDSLVPALARVLYTARESLLNPLMAKPRQNDEASLESYRMIQERIRESVQGHMIACGENYHVIGSAAVNSIDEAARRLFKILDEATAPIQNGDPVSRERRAELLNELETMRRTMLEKFWHALDTNALESSFQEVHEPLSKESNAIPDILRVTIEPDDLDHLESSHIHS